MTSVLISIKPEWCEKIASGEKTIEVRKTRPKIEPPFKVYIYCTKGKDRLIQVMKDGDENYGEVYHGKPVFIKGKPFDLYYRRGKVFGEFICNEILVDTIGQHGLEFEVYGCIPFEMQKKYAGKKTLYGWRISDLVIYEKPKELSEFSRFGAMFKGCACLNRGCKNYIESVSYDEPPECGIDDCFLRRPPQSWCYVEELEE